MVHTPEGAKAHDTDKPALVEVPGELARKVLSLVKALEASGASKLKKMDSLAPEVMKAFWAFDKAAVADGAIPVKYKELIAVAVALTTQCPYCIDIHSGNARKAGATEAEIVEAAMVAASLRAGAAVTHATHALGG